MSKKETNKFQSIIIDQLKPYDVLMPELIKTAANIKSEAEDFLLEDVPEAAIEIDYDNNLTFSEFPGSRKTFQTTENSLRQLCEKLTIPFSFYQKLQNSPNFNKEKKEIAKNLVEELSMYYKFPKARGLMIRTYKKLIRAVLSNSYSIFDSDKITQMTDDCIKNSIFHTKDLMIGSYINDFERFQVRIIHTDPLHMDNNETIYCGLTIESSDIGNAKLATSFYIYEDLQSNGISIDANPYANEKLYSQIHIGTDPQKIEKGLTTALEKFPDMKENIKSYLNKATQTDLTKSGLYNPKSYNGRHMMKELELSDKDIDEFMKIVEQRPKTLKDYIMAISQFARQCRTEKRCFLEKMAGKILLHPDHYGIRKENE